LAAAVAAQPFIKRYLLTAGPTPIPPAVQAALGEPVLYHRSPEFDALFKRVLERLPAVFATANDVMLFTCSGTGGMESAVANLVRPGQAMLACAAGKFGERWIDLGEAYGARVVRHEPPWGARIDPADVDRLLGENPDVEVVFATLSETSTGIVHDVRALAETARAHDALLVVDAISGLGATELRQDEWGVDVVVAGSQKALMCPPGLALVSASERALARAAAQPGGRHYLDWGRQLAEQRKPAPATPFTPAVSLVRALDVALDLIEEEGLENVLARHRVLAAATRAGVRAMGLELFGDPDERSTVVTAVALPDSVDGGRVPRLLRERCGITANGGQGQLKGRILRIAHCGYFGGFDVLIGLAGLEMVLRELGADVEPGSGAGAAQQAFLDAGVELTPAA
jgi:aspartate aminotransferase-like enzyme